MAGVSHQGILFLKGLLILCIFSRIHTLGDSSQLPTEQYQHDQTIGVTGIRLRPHYKLNGFNGYELLNTTGKRTYKSTVYPGITLSNNPRLGHVTQIIFVALARSGDIESQPGPRTATTIPSKKRKYIIKFPCQLCFKGVRCRPVSCNSCKSITHAKCISGMTPELYDNYYKHNVDTVPFICKFCENHNTANNSSSLSKIILEQLRSLQTQQYVPSSPTLTHTPPQQQQRNAAREEEEGEVATQPPPPHCV